MPTAERSCTAPPEIAKTRFDVNASNAIACGGGDYFLSERFLRRYGPEVVRHFARYLRPPMAKADIYGALLIGDEYLEQSRDHLREGDDAGAVHSLRVLAGIVAVLLGQIPSSEQHSVH